VTFVELIGGRTLPEGAEGAPSCRPRRTAAKAHARHLQKAGQGVLPWLILKTGLALMSDRENEGNVRTGFVGIQRYVAALTVRDHELA
jgi:hypothetical protein